MQSNDQKPPMTSTYSIVGYEPETEKLGVAAQSKFLAIGSIVPYIKWNVGAVATQAQINPTYGPSTLQLLERGNDPEEIVETLTALDSGSVLRQVGIVDAEGRSATYTGEQCIEWAGGICGENYAAQGNLLVNGRTIEEMVKTFKTEEGSLADRLLSSLFAAEEAGGDRRGKQSASLLVYKEGGGYGGFTNKYIDLRVDDSEKPIEDLADLLELFKLYYVESDVEHTPLEGDTLCEVQMLLSDLGYYKGEPSCVFDEKFRQALIDFYHQEDFEQRYPGENTIPQDILQYLRERAHIMEGS
ncbi:DUF1028 domain-containing protein [Halarsenatibacter silvermanii]|uniref:Uncharacterized conserved protein, Ntn-hydrolase superfamily n=1 Tax=Halarsenatibacter silvermanii TaxID=321763 RepID=A0A1G9ITL6_9FIRM|nr:DUF1028 domain-containing protein [Halarsenatibacter silvermanii]SDL28510.1 Uncharacterized conserved protein, Ntn-hydrolase superfamily [Halarsenatibacter silvermanii]